MKLLLDTHILVWSLLDPCQLKPHVIDLLEAPDTELWLSPITCWEILILAEKGRINLKDAPNRWLRRILREIPLRDAALTLEVAMKSREVKLPHQDPADRFIVATALIYDLVLVTSDAEIIAARPCSLLSNR